MFESKLRYKCKLSYEKHRENFANSFSYVHFGYLYNQKTRKRQLRNENHHFEFSYWWISMESVFLEFIRSRDLRIVSRSKTTTTLKMRPKFETENTYHSINQFQSIAFCKHPEIGCLTLSEGNMIIDNSMININMINLSYQHDNLMIDKENHCYRHFVHYLVNVHAIHKCFISLVRESSRNQARIDHISI